jgi:hypothetical protein
MVVRKESLDARSTKNLRGRTSTTMMFVRTTRIQNATPLSSVQYPISTNTTTTTQERIFPQLSLVAFSSMKTSRPLSFNDHRVSYDSPHRSFAIVDPTTTYRTETSVCPIWHSPRCVVGTTIDTGLVASRLVPARWSNYRESPGRTYHQVRSPST